MSVSACVDASVAVRYVAAQHNRRWAMPGVAPPAAQDRSRFISLQTTEELGIQPKSRRLSSHSGDL